MKNFHRSHSLDDFSRFRRRCTDARSLEGMVFCPADSNKQEQKAVQMLVDEIAVRTQIAR